MAHRGHARTREGADGPCGDHYVRIDTVADSAKASRVCRSSDLHPSSSSFASSGGILRGSLFSPYYDTLRSVLMPSLRFLRRWRGFTLIELLVVIAIIAILIGLLLARRAERCARPPPACSAATTSSRLALATINCADTNQGNLPPSIGLYPSMNAGTQQLADGGIFLSHPAVHRAGQPVQRDLSPARCPTTATAPTRRTRSGRVRHPTLSKTYICPSDSTQITTSLGPYASYGVNGQVFRENYPPAMAMGTPASANYPATITDGTSNTIFFTDKLAETCNLPAAATTANNYWPDWGPIISSTD